MPLTDEEKRVLARLANPDYGVAGGGYDTLGDVISTEPLPGTNSSADFLNTAGQLLRDLTKKQRLDDGFRGERLAKIIHMEVRDYFSVPDKLFVKGLLETVPAEERDANECDTRLFGWYIWRSC